MEKKNKSAKLPKTIFIVGLGNPGEQYKDTPHSTGFAVVDKFARDNNFPAFEMKTSGILTAEKQIGSWQVILAKPQMFMNNSGKSLAKLFLEKKIKKAKSYPFLWVINDDLDIPLGKIKIVINRGSAGHKGVQSIADQLKTKNFARFRVGIQTPEVLGKKMPANKFVLKKFLSEDEKFFDGAIALTANALQTALANGIEKAMTEFNK